MKRFALVSTLLFLFCAAVSFGQTITGTINGTVTDPSGGAVTSAKITARNVATNLTNQADVNSSGNYNLLFLPVGQYVVTAEGRGNGLGAGYG